MSAATGGRLARLRGSLRRSHAARVRLSKLGLAVGWVALAAAVLVAHRSPATGYELSIYAATPTGFWVGVGAAALAALLVAWQAGVPRAVRLTAVGLVGSAGFAVAALPVLRGYYYVGAGDSLTHLGWAADLAVGRLEPTAFLYPAVHSIAVFVSRATGVGLPLAIQYTVLAFVACFLLFVPLCARAVAGTDLALVAGAFAAVLLAPVNNVSAHLMAHPTTQAVFFLPVVLYLLVRYVTSPPAGPKAAGGSGSGGRLARLRRLLSVTPIGVLLALVSAATVLIHPQAALTLAVALLAVVVVQAYGRRAWPGGPETRHRPLYGQTAFLVAAFALWAPRNERVQGTVEGVVSNLLGDAAVADEVLQRGTSLAALGSSLPELFARLFGPTVVLALLAAGISLAALRGRLDDDPESAAIIRYLAAAALPAIGGFALFFGLSVSTQAFRYSAFATAIGTVLAAVAVATWGERLARKRSGRTVRVAVVAGVAVLLPLAAMTAFASPTIYQPSRGVSQATVDGYAASFETRAPGVPFAGVRSGSVRYVHATYGTTPVVRDEIAIPGQTAAIPGPEFGPGLADRYDVARYVPVSDRDVAREVALYGGLRYDEAGFRALETNPGIHRVRSNGGFRLYLVDAA